LSSTIFRSLFTGPHNFSRTPFQSPRQKAQLRASIAYRRLSTHFTAELRVNGQLRLERKYHPKIKVS